MKLPAIDLEKITTIDDAKNIIEQIMSLLLKQQEEIEHLRSENNRLKGQPKKPIFPSATKNRSISVTNLLKEKGAWHKSIKKGKVITDRTEQMPEV